QYALIEHQGSLSLLALNYAQYLLVSHQLSQPPLATEMLLSPLSFSLSTTEKQQLTTYQPLLTQLAIDISHKHSKLTLYSVPTMLRRLNWQQFMPQLLECLGNGVHNQPQLIAYMAQQAQQQMTQWTQAQAIQLLAELERHLPH